MKRYHSNKTLLFLLAILFSITIACTKEKESEGISKVTTFVQIELTGGEIYSHRIGTPYTEPGFLATDIGDNNKIVTSSVIVTGSDDVDSDVAGVYPVTYSVNNSDGFNTTVVRQVVVFDNSSVSSVDLTGTYISNIVRTTFSTGVVGSRGPHELNITKITTGLFSIEDFLGAWYWKGIPSNPATVYGIAYTYPGLFVLKGDNSIALVSGDENVPWGGHAILDLTPGDASHYNPATGQILLNSYMDNTPNYRFAVTLVKKPE